MRSLLPWVFPVGLLGSVALVSMSTLTGDLLTVGWGLAVFPCLAVYLRSRSRISPGGDDTDYWRTTLR